MFKNLKSFINFLHQKNEVVVIDEPTDPKLEIPEIHRRVIAAHGPALLFKNVIGSDFPIVTNLFGTKNRVEYAFGQRPLEFIESVATLPEKILPPNLQKIWQEKKVFLDLLKVGLKKISHAPVLENNIPHQNLQKIPALTSWPEDGGPFITLPLVLTKGIKPPALNLGMYRIQIHDEKKAGLHFQIGKGGGFHFHEHEMISKNLPVHIFLGGPPALILSAIAPLPEHIPELLLCSLLLGKRLPLAYTNESPLPIISEAEFCLIGEAPPKIRYPEGPFGDHYGYYSLKHDYPVFIPKKIYHRKDAIYPATVVGNPSQENFYIGNYL